MWAKAASYLLQSVPLNLALPQFLQQHELGLLQSQLLLQLLNDTLPLSWAALLHSTEHSGTLQKNKFKKKKKWNPFRLLNIPWFLWVLNPPLTTQCNISEVQTCTPSTKIYKSSQLSESRALSSNARFLTLVSHHEQVRVQLFKVAEPVHRWTRGVIIWQNDDVIIFRGWRALLSFYTPGQK